jgi:hypothetical protein
MENQNARNELLSKLEQEELKLKQKVLDKENIEKEKQDLLIQMEEQKKENLNLKYQYDMKTHKFKNKIE